MSWTPATSIGTRAAHPSRMRILSEHRESTDLCRSYRVGSGLVGEDSSPGPVRRFSRRKIPLSPVSSNFAHRLGAHRADARAHSRKRKGACFAQFWCNLTPLDATLLSHLVCVASKELAQNLSPLDATLIKNIGGWGESDVTPKLIPPGVGVLFNPYFLTSLSPYFSSTSPEAPVRA